MIKNAAIERILRRVDQAYRAESVFALMKARLLWIFCWLLVAFVPLNLLKLAAVQPPGIPVRIWFNLIFLGTALATLRTLITGRLSLAGGVLVLATVLPVNLTLFFLNDFQQPLGAAISLFIFNVIFLLIALVFSSRSVAFFTLLVSLGAQFAFHARTFTSNTIPGSLDFASDTLLRDGFIAIGFIFCLGVTFSKLIEAAQSRGEETLAKSRKMNENLENVVSERTAALEAATARANDASRAKGEFLANMSHEIRTPLHAVIASSELLLANKSLPQDVGEKIRIIADAGELLMNQIGDILDLTKIESGQVEIESEPFSLRILISDCTSLMQSRADAAKVELTSSLGPDLLGYFLGDGFRLRQVVLNLLSNAIKFTPPEGKVSLCVSPLPQTSDPSSEIRFTVTDTGIGMDASTQKKVFERFAQATPSTSRQYGGTGLGLAICLHLVDLMGGKLEVDSTPGQGSKFTFALPLKPSSEPETIGPSDVKFSQFGLHILVADDNATNRKILGLQLERLGCSVDMATDGVEALDMLECNNLPDLILMDCQMPRLDGCSATRAIRSWASESSATPQQQKASQIPVIALTAATSAEDRTRCIEAGMGGFLSKPVKLADLQYALHKAVPNLPE